MRALKDRLKEEQRVIKSLNMAPNPRAAVKNKVWFEKPWIVELADGQSFAYAAGSKLVCGEDGNMEVLREDLHSHEQVREQEAKQANLEPPPSTDVKEDLVDDGVLAIVVMESKTRDVVAEVLSQQEEHVRVVPVPTKVEAFVEFDGNKIYKSILMG